jgi:membrane protease YdiL (CAAX protease family)
MVFAEGLIMKKKSKKRVQKTDRVVKVDKTKKAILVIGVFLISYIAWAIYRYATAQDVLGAKENFFIDQLAQPIIWLIPPILFIFFYEKRQKLKDIVYSLGVTRKHLLSSIVMGLFLAYVFYVAMSLIEMNHLSLYGIFSGEALFVWNYGGYTLAQTIIMTLTVFLIIGPVEELVDRGFLQKRLADIYTPLIGIGTASALFAASHIPVSVFVYHLSAIKIATYMLFTGSFGVIMGYLYHKSKNIIGPILLHGFWDFLAFYYLIGFGVTKIPGDELWFFFFALTTLVVFTAFCLTIIYFCSILFRWEGEKPLPHLTIRHMTYTLKENIVPSVTKQKKKPTITLRASIPVFVALSMIAYIFVFPIPFAQNGQPAGSSTFQASQAPIVVQEELLQKTIDIKAGETQSYMFKVQKENVTKLLFKFETEDGTILKNGVFNIVVILPNSTSDDVKIKGSNEDRMVMEFAGTDTGLYNRDITIRIEYNSNLNLQIIHGKVKITVDCEFSQS